MIYWDRIDVSYGCHDFLMMSINLDDITIITKHKRC